MANDKKILKSKVLLFLAGGGLMVLGTTLVLVWWGDVLVLFRGTIGVVIALAGLLVLNMIHE